MLSVTLYEFKFQSTRPVRGATMACWLRCHKSAISIHAPRAGRDQLASNTLPAIGISIHAPRAGRDMPPLVRQPSIAISIHAPRAGRDSDGSRSNSSTIEISIHAPRAGRDQGVLQFHDFRYYFNPRAPCGARRKTGLDPVDGLLISIHAPRAGRDATITPIIKPCSVFQSTRPVRGATTITPMIKPCSVFQSTRPVRGATAESMRFPYSHHNFNPRAPCGARQQKYTKLLYTLLRQKAILRQFHAKRRLLKRFSTYKYRNTFLICSANRMGKICTLPLRTTRSLDLPEGMSACSQSARFCFRTFFPSSKTADYPALDP